MSRAVHEHATVTDQSTKLPLAVQFKRNTTREYQIWALRHVERELHEVREGTAPEPLEPTLRRSGDVPARIQAYGDVP